MYKGYQYIPGVGTQGQWVRVKNLYMKTTPSNYSGASATNFTDSSKNWRRQSSWRYKKSNGVWVTVHTKTGTGVVFTIAPAIHVYSSPYPYGPNNGITISSPRTLNTVLYGKDGYWNPYITSSVSRSFRATYFADGANKFTIDNDDVWNLTTNSSRRFDADKTYLYYQVSVNANSDNSVAQSTPGVYLVRDVPSGTVSGLTQTPNIGAQLSFSVSVDNHWYDYPDLIFLDWYRSSTTSVSGGTLLDTIYIGGGDGGGTPVTSTQYRTVIQADAGYYIIGQIRARNSWTDLYGFGDTYYVDSKATSSTVTAPLAITAGPITDAGIYNASGYDNRDNLPIGVGYYVYATATGVNSSTTYRTRYRFYNWQNQKYYSSNGTTQLGVNGSGYDSNNNSVWSDTYTANSSGSGSISTVTISGGTANIKDYYNIPYSPFSSLTYNVGQSRWNIEIEISAIKSGVTETAYYDSNLSAGSIPTISASPSSISPGGSSTISGSITGYPTGYSAYPTQYKVYFGDGSDSGWQYVGYGVSNPSYSFNHTYSNAGSYSPSIVVYPYYQGASTVVIAQNQLATPSGVNATDDRTDGVNVTWNAVSGASYYGVWYGPPPSYDALADFGGNRDVNLITGTSYLDTAISAGNSRDYYVQAYASGNPTGTKSNWGGPNNGLRVAAPVITYGSCSTYGQSHSFTSSGSECSGTYYHTYTDYYYPQRRQVLSNGVWNGTYDYGCGYSVQRSTTSFSQVVGQCGYNPVSIPSTPTGLYVTTSGAVSWDAVSGATSYEILYYTAQSSSGLNRGGPYDQTGISGTSYQLSGPYAYPDNWVRVQVRARNSAGVSTYGAWFPSNSTYV
jgi:hypothetical protein